MVSRNNYFNWKQNNSFSNSNFSSWTYKKTNKNFVRYSAGILPYSFDQNGQLFFLLGKDNDNDWSDFGGRCEYKDQNEPINTATREFFEESLGAVLNIQECTNVINENNKIVSKTLNGSPYYMYPIYIEYVNYSDTFQKTKEYLKYQFDNSITSKLIEKTAIRWVSMDTLMNNIENKNPSSPISLRGVFYRTICQFKEKLVFLQR
jgi:hypothetical protein